MIDLHLHTNASDGTYSPGDLVGRAAGAGLTVIAVTDHDTTAATRDVRGHAHERGIEAISGIEITAVEGDRDVHVLAYFLDPAELSLVEFLARQRATRLARVEAIAARLASLGMPVDVQPLVDDVRRQGLRSLGRPEIARAMIAAGHVADTREAFDKWLGRDAPAFVPRPGAPVEAVIAIIHRAGGLASLAHPGRTGIDDRIPALRDRGLDALEVYHTDHDDGLRDRYRRLAHGLGLLVTGGSDYHGDPAYGLTPGAATLPVNDWRRLEAARHRHVSR